MEWLTYLIATAVLLILILIISIVPICNIKNDSEDIKLNKFAESAASNLNWCVAKLHKITIKIHFIAVNKY